MKREATCAFDFQVIAVALLARVHVAKKAQPKIRECSLLQQVHKRKIEQKVNWCRQDRRSLLHFLGVRSGLGYFCIMSGTTATTHHVS